MAVHSRIAEDLEGTTTTEVTVLTAEVVEVRSAFMMIKWYIEKCGDFVHGISTKEEMFYKDFQNQVNQGNVIMIVNVEGADRVD